MTKIWQHGIVCNIIPYSNSSKSTSVNDSEKRAFENIVGKEVNAGNKHFFLFPQYFFSILSKPYLAI